MIYLNDKVGNVNNVSVQQYSCQSKLLINKNNINTPQYTVKPKLIVKNNNLKDSVSFSGNQTNDDKSKRNKIIAGIIAGVALIGGIILLVKKGKISEDAGKSLKNGAENLGKKESGHTKIKTKNIDYSSSSGSSSHPPKNTSPADLGNSGKAVNEQDVTIATQKNNITEQEKQISQLEEESRELDKKISELDNNPKPDNISTTAKKESDKITQPVKENPEKNLFDEAFDMYTDELCKNPELQGKKTLIRETLPDFQKITKINNDLISGIDDEKEILKVITQDNKDFMLQKAIPKILERAKDLNINDAKSVGAVLETLSPEVLAKTDSIADIIKGFNVGGSSNTIELFNVFKKDSNNFILKQIFPHFASNLDKYGISSAEDLANLLKVITPKNKDFMFNEAFPAILKIAEKLEISGSEIAEIAGELNPKTLKNMKIIADNLDKFDIKDSMDCIVLNKLNPLLKKDSSELLK